MENIFKRVNAAKIKIPNGNTVLATESIDSSEINFVIFDDNNRKIKELILSTDELKYAMIIALLFNTINLKEIVEEFFNIKKR